MKLLQIAIAPMLALYLIKTYYIYYYTSRGISLGYPYDALTFNIPDRFTDWLIMLFASNLPNPYHVPASVAIPHMPYGYSTFILMKAANLIGPHFSFGVCIIAFLTLNYIFLQTQLSVPPLTAITIFLALIVGFYPIYLEVDRGNVVIFTAIALTALFVCHSRGFPHICSILLLALIVALKPANLLFMLPILLYADYRQLLAAFTIVFVNYIAPIFLPSGTKTYMYDEIRAASAFIGPQHLFCHNLACGLRALQLPGPSITIAFIFAAITLFLAVLIRIRLNPLIGVPFTVALVTITSLLVADPSSDYALTLLLPIFIYFTGLPRATIRAEEGFKSDVLLIAVGFVMATGFVNLYIPQVGDWYTVVRSAGLFIMYFASVKYVLSLIPAKLSRTKKTILSLESEQTV